jgi:hypothetical protein
VRRDRAPFESQASRALSCSRQVSLRDFRWPRPRPGTSRDVGRPTPAHNNTGMGNSICPSGRGLGAPRFHRAFRQEGTDAAALPARPPLDGANSLVHAVARQQTPSPVTRGGTESCEGAGLATPRPYQRSELAIRHLRAAAGIAFTIFPELAHSMIRMRGPRRGAGLRLSGRGAEPQHCRSRSTPMKIYGTERRDLWGPNAETLSPPSSFSSSIRRRARRS